MDSLSDVFLGTVLEKRIMARRIVVFNDGGRLKKYDLEIEGETIHLVLL